jgi:alginate O-acetyltransferase complex protein AlgI
MTLPATDGIMEKLQALLSYDASSPLIFSSGLFLFLFAGFMLIYNAFRRAPMARIVYVILFSLYFYYKSSGIYFLLLIFAATSDFLIAQGIYRVRSRAAKRWLVVLSVMVNLGMLGYFKYTNFLVDIANQMFGQGFLQFQNIFLPVGISFFVFQSMSYTIDIYRGQLKPLGNWCDYLFYLSFFPQLVAGPIVRARDFIPQIRREMFGTGVFLILTGLFKKAIISDYISLNFVDRIFDEPLLYSGFECLAGIYGYALQIYCDFSGYSDMAIGLGAVLGFHFPENFNYPYVATSVKDFWHRWHISLSTWFKEYVYIPLGGNRKGLPRQLFNILVVWMLTGIWHGAGWNFLFWGLWFALFLILEKLFLGEVLESVPKVFGRVYTLAVVLISWVFFALESPGEILAYLQAMFGMNGVGPVNSLAMFLSNEYLVLLVIALVACLPLGSRLVHALKSSKTGPAMALYRLGEKVIPAVLLLLSVAYIVDASYNPFLYFRF